MGKLVSDDFAGPLASRLRSVDVERIVEQAFDITVDEALEILRIELPLDGYPEAVAEAVEVLDSSSAFTATVGVAGDSPAAQMARDYEYGSIDHRIAPHGLFRDVEGDMVLIAAEEIKARLEDVIDG